MYYGPLSNIVYFPGATYHYGDIKFQSNSDFYIGESGNLSDRLSSNSDHEWALGGAEVTDYKFTVHGDVLINDSTIYADSFGFAQTDNNAKLRFFGHDEPYTNPSGAIKYGPAVCIYDTYFVGAGWSELIWDDSEHRIRPAYSYHDPEYQ